VNTVSDKVLLSIDIIWKESDFYEKFKSSQLCAQAAASSFSCNRTALNG